MIDRQLETLRETPVPPAREAAKAKAMAAAMAAFEAAPVVVTTPRAGPKPFMLRHGYKIAASLATICVLGPLLFSAMPGREQAQIAGNALRARTVARAPEMPAAELKIAPPVVLVAPVPAVPAAAPLAQPAAPVPPPAAAAPSTYYGLDNTNSSTRFGSSAAPAKQPAQVATPDPECPPGRQCLKAFPDGLIAKKAAEDQSPAAGVARSAESAAKTATPRPINVAILTTFDTAVLASLRDAIENGRALTRGDIGVSDLVNAFNYNPARTSPERPLTIALTLVAAPWRPSRKLAHFTFSSFVPLAPEVLKASLTIDFASLSEFRFVTAGKAGFALPPTGSPSAQLIPDFSRRTIVAIFDLLPIEALSPARPLATLTVIMRTEKNLEIRTSLPYTLNRELPSLAAAPTDVRFAIAIARFVDLLVGVAENPEAFGYDETIALAEGALGADPSGERAAFVALMRRAKALRR